METAHSVLELVQFLVLPSCALLTAPHVQGTHSPSWNCMRTWDVNDSSKRVCLQTISWTEFACFRLCGDKLHALSRKKSYVLESTWELLGGNGRWMWWMGHSSIVAWIIGSLRLPPTEWTYDSVSCLRIMILAEWTLVPLVASVCLDHHRLLPPNWRTLGLLSGVSEGEVAAGVLPHSHGRYHYIPPISMDWTWLNILSPTVSVQIVQQTIHIWSVNFAETIPRSCWFLAPVDYIPSRSTMHLGWSWLILALGESLWPDCFLQPVRFWSSLVRVVNRSGGAQVGGLPKTPPGGCRVIGWPDWWGSAFVATMAGSSGSKT